MATKMEETGGGVVALEMQDSTKCKLDTIATKLKENNSDNLATESNSLLSLKTQSSNSEHNNNGSDVESQSENTQVGKVNGQVENGSETNGIDEDCEMESVENCENGIADDEDGIVEMNDVEKNDENGHKVENGHSESADSLQVNDNKQSEKNLKDNAIKESDESVPSTGVSNGHCETSALNQETETKTEGETNPSSGKESTHVPSEITEKINCDENPKKCEDNQEEETSLDLTQKKDTLNIPHQKEEMKDTGMTCEQEEEMSLDLTQKNGSAIATEQNDIPADLTPQKEEPSSPKTTPLTTPQTTPPTPTSSRKNRRKNMRPQSIAQQQQAYKQFTDELKQQEKDVATETSLKENIKVTPSIDHDQDQEIDFEALERTKLNSEYGYMHATTKDEDADSGVLDLSYAARVREFKEMDDDYQENKVDDGVLDLSCGTKISDFSLSGRSSILSSSGTFSDTNHGDNKSASASASASYTTEKVVPKTEPTQGIPQGPSQQVNALTEYAENTMHELLGIYGLSESGDQKPKGILGKNNAALPALLSLGMKMEAKSVKSETPPAQSHNLHPLAMTHLSIPMTASPEPSSPTSPASSLAAMKGGVESMYKKMAAGLISGMGNADGGVHSSSTEALSKMLNLKSTAELGSRGTDRFASSSAYINALFDPQMGPKLLSTTSPDGKTMLPDYTKYVKKYNGFEDCGGEHCKDLQYREHFHCVDCNFKIFIKKEEMIRHFKWHKKRDESLQHGFMRYSPSDDCGIKFTACAHNGKQTHYHCIQMGCKKVYISTSDVQMHSNYHRKDSAIIQEGFQRFRATEDCGTPECLFHGQRTTHFHCRRAQCGFTFKNKADMEKHKTYHQKDEQLSKDGFKKFMKYETCQVPACRYSNVANHIHCIRAGCNYVLHSTGQLLSHKRKHERRDIERAYLRYKDQKQNRTSEDNQKASSITSALLASHRQQQQQQQQQLGSTSSEGYFGQSQPKPLKVKEYIAMEEQQQQQLLQAAHSSSDTKPSLWSDSSMDTKPPLMWSDSESSCSIQDAPADLSMNSTKSLKNSLGNSTNSLGYPTSFLHGSSPIKPIEIKPDYLDAENHALPLTLARLTNKIQGNGDGGEEKEETEKGEEDRAYSPQTGMSPSGFCPKVSPPVNEKKERDETWKRFLTRYTANDHCHSRCQFLYKDHYHCNTPICGMLYRSKDGVREHAKHHEQQERISELSYTCYDADASCYDSCPYKQKQKHYHCKWADCKQVIAESDPVFTRLEHYKIHEYSRNHNLKRPATMPLSLSLPMPEVKRKRGRPPKYPKSEIPVVPKIEMTEEDIAKEIQKQGMSSPIASGFRKFLSMQPCPDDKCIYFMREHYHCVRQRCHHATDRADVLNLHAKDFHSFITILEGFAFFDRNVNCRRPHCHNNKANRHYHCVRPRCDYSFVRYSTMAQHDKKHKLQELTRLQQQHGGLGVAVSSTAVSTATTMGSFASLLGQLPMGLNPGQVILSPTAVANSTSQSVVKASGTFFPITTHIGPLMFALPTSATTSIASTASNRTTASILMSSSPPPIFIHPDAKALKNIAPKPAPAASTVTTPVTLVTPSVPLATLLQQKGANILPTPSWNKLVEKMFCPGNENCGRPFCKLKKRDHYHCFDCNQAFSDTLRLKQHIQKHGIKVDGQQPEKATPTTLSIPHVPQPQAAGLSMSMNTATDLSLKSLTQVEEVELSDDEEEDGDGELSLNHSSSLNLSAGTFSRILVQGQGQRDDATKVEEKVLDSDEEGDLVMDLSASAPEQVDTEETAEETGEEDEDLSALRRSGRKRSATKHEDFIDSDVVATVIAGKIGGKVRRSHSPRASGSRDEATITPAGFDKYRFDIDCKFQRCAYRLNNTHYHCVREQCAFALGDRSRAPGHLEKHRKTDALITDEFQHFTQHCDCGREKCEMNQKLTHFHCLKCEFSCIESCKVHSHRRHHQNLLKEKSKMSATAAAALNQPDLLKQFAAKMAAAAMDQSEAPKEAAKMAATEMDQSEVSDEPCDMSTKS